LTIQLIGCLISVVSIIQFFEIESPIYKMQCVEPPTIHANRISMSLCVLLQICCQRCSCIVYAWRVFKVRQRCSCVFVRHQIFQASQFISWIHSVVETWFQANVL